MKRIFKKGIVKVAATLSALAVVATPTIAFADGGGGVGSGKNWGTVTSMHRAYSNGWNEFVRNSGFRSEAAIVSRIAAQTPDMVNKCRKSKGIWWVRASKGLWLYNYQNGVRLGGKTSYLGDVDYYTSTPPSAAIIRAGNKVLDTTVGLGGYSTLRGTYEYFKGGGGLSALTILCSYDGEDRYVDENVPFVDKEKIVYDKVYPYYYSSSFTPMLIEGQYVGGAKWQPQAPHIKKTEFSKVYDRLAAGTTSLKADEVKRMVEAAVEKDKGLNYDTAVELSEANKKAFANGGVVNVSEYTQYARVRAVTDVDVHKVKTCKYKIDVYGRKSLVSCQSPKEVKRVYKNAVSKELRTPYQSGFWQMILVHCNQAGFDSLISSTPGATVMSRDNDGGRITLTAKSKYYVGSQGRPAQPTKLDFGQPGTASGKIGFYDKECAYSCTAEPSSESSTGSSGHPASGNLRSPEGGMKDSGQLYGADDGKDFRGNFFTLFRDNQESKVHLDVWYPRTSGDVNPQGKQPVTTTITRWDKGTPDVKATDAKGGKLTMNVATGGRKGKELFAGKPSDVAPTQKNWDTTAFSSSTTEILPGSVNEFIWRGSWASEEGLPNIFNVKWEYEPNVRSSIPSKLGSYRVGVSNTGMMAASPTDVWVPIQGKCYAEFGRDTGADRRSLFENYTGTGTENKMDIGLVDGTGNGNPSGVNTNLVLQFVRSTAE